MKALLIPADETQPIQTIEWDPDNPDTAHISNLMLVSTFNHSTAWIAYEVMSDETNTRATSLLRHFTDDYGTHHHGTASGDFLVGGITPDNKEWVDLPEDIIEYATTNLRPL